MIHGRLIPLPHPLFCVCIPQWRGRPLPPPVAVILKLTLRHKTDFTDRAAASAASAASARSFRSFRRFYVCFLISLISYLV